MALAPKHSTAGSPPTRVTLHCPFLFLLSFDFCLFVFGEGSRARSDVAFENAEFLLTLPLEFILLEMTSGLTVMIMTL